MECLFRNWTFYIQCCLLYSTLLQQSSKIQHWKLDLKLLPSFPVKFCFNRLIRFEVLKLKNMQQLECYLHQYVNMSKDHVYCLSNSVWFLLQLLQPKPCGFGCAGPVISPYNLSSITSENQGVHRVQVKEVQGFKKVSGISGLRRSRLSRRYSWSKGSMGSIMRSIGPMGPFSQLDPWCLLGLCRMN